MFLVFHVDSFVFYYRSIYKHISYYLQNCHHLFTLWLFISLYRFPDGKVLLLVLITFQHRYMHQVIVILINGHNLRPIHGLDDLAPSIATFDSLCSFALSPDPVGLQTGRMLADTLVVVSAGRDEAPLGIGECCMGTF